MRHFGFQELRDEATRNGEESDWQADIFDCAFQPTDPAQYCNATKS